MPVLHDNADLLFDSLQRIERKAGIESVAWVVMPDHLHLIIDPRQSDLSLIMKRIKLSFAQRYRTRHGMYRGTVWQSRFWDHAIRDQDDMNRHIDYIRYNPVKHGLTASPFDWPYSSIHEYLKDGFYDEDWGTVEEIVIDVSSANSALTNITES